MIGLGTIVNSAAIALGGIAGTVVGKRFSEKTQQSILSACGILVIFLGVSGTLQQMFTINSGKISTGGTMMMLASVILGTLVGSLIDIDKRIETFGQWLKRKTGNDNDAKFVSAFVSASLTVCVGAMAVIGSITEGITGDHSILFTKSILDCVIIIGMASSMGIGTSFSAIPVFVVQGLVTLLSRYVAPLMTDAAMANLSYIGNILIACVGINLLFPKKIDVANMLPSLIIAIAWAFIPGLPK